MCLAIAGRIKQIEGDAAVVDYDGLLKQASILLLPNLAVGDYVLVHAGFAIQKVDPDYAQELIELEREIRG